MSKRAIRISEMEAARDFRSLIHQVQTGAEVVIERDAEPIAVIRPANARIRPLSDSLRLARVRRSNATLDGNFGSDLDAVIDGHRDPLTPTAWSMRPWRSPLTPR